MLAATRRLFAEFTLSAFALLCVTSLAQAADTPRPQERTVMVARPAPLEAIYSKRAGQSLRQYGYDLFSAGSPAPSAPTGAARDDQILGIGDELTVTLRGQKSTSRRYVIDSDGRLLIDDLRPLTVAGMTFGEMRRHLEAEIAATAAQTDVYVSLSAVHRMSVLVVGEVAQPGRQELSGFALLFDALSAVGGINRTGSLRQIQIVRSGTRRTYDLYALLDGSGDGDPALHDGDRIVVPPLGPTFAVSGPVKRPGIFELPAGHDGIAPDAALAAAGGPLLPGVTRLLRFALTVDGRETVSEVPADQNIVIGDGDIILPQAPGQARRGSVALTGHVRRPGPRALASSETLGRLIETADLLPNPYLAFAALETTDPATRARTLLAVDLGAVLDGRADPLLNDDDLLIVLGTADVEFLTSAPVLALMRGQPARPTPACGGLTLLGRALSADPDGILARGPLVRAAIDLVPADAPCPAVFDRHPDLLVFALEHSALVRGGVARPGFYPTAGASALNALARSAGGAGESLAVIDGLNGKSRMRGGQTARGGDIVDSIVPRIELLGHVRHPGTRPLSANPTLRAVLGDAKQLQADAYALFGIVERYDRGRLAQMLVPFAPRDVIAGKTDRVLMDGDRIRIYSIDEIRDYVESDTDLTETKTPVTGPVPAGKTNVKKIPVVDGAVKQGVVVTPVADGAAKQDVVVTRTDDPASTDTSRPNDTLRKLLKERSIAVRGAVRLSGLYPVAESASAGALIAAAGGLADNADARSIEITTLSEARSENRPPDREEVDEVSRRRVIAFSGSDGPGTELFPGDAVRVNPLFSDREARSVTIAGEVRYPGEYDVIRGEKLASLIARAGGLTGQAYPAGSLFTRESARRQETLAYERAARELDRGLALVLLKDGPPPAEQINLARQLADQLRTAPALGRITVEADPAVLAVRPDLDILLEPGDRILIPRRPLTVTVSGEVLAPASLQFAPEKTADAYLREAGGTTRFADDERTFVVLPNGSAQPLSVSFWDHTPVHVQPGSTIIVPRDPEPFDFFKTAQNIGGVLSQLAISAASLAILSDR
jgi:polysaccharide biosynthesis/export protein